MRPSKNEYMLSIADLTAKMSTCSRLQVGAVLTDSTRSQVWVGYNGGPRGGANACRHENREGGCGCVHAEANAVVKAPGHVPKIAYLTCSPCELCAVLLVNAGVFELHYSSFYRSHEGLKILAECDVQLFYHGSLEDEPKEPAYWSAPYHSYERLIPDEHAVVYVPPRRNA